MTPKTGIPIMMRSPISLLVARGSQRDCESARDLPSHTSRSHDVATTESVGAHFAGVCSKSARREGHACAARLFEKTEVTRCLNLLEKVRVLNLLRR